MYHRTREGNEAYESSIRAPLRAYPVDRTVYHGLKFGRPSYQGKRLPVMGARLRRSGGGP
jgi:hypothetical protein